MNAVMNCGEFVDWLKKYLFLKRVSFSQFVSLLHVAVWQSCRDIFEGF